jgi:hypothetical protein
MSITETPVLDDLTTEMISPELDAMTLASLMDTNGIGLEPILSSLVEHQSLLDLLDQNEQM